MVLFSVRVLAPWPRCTVVLGIRRSVGKLGEITG